MRYPIINPGKKMHGRLLFMITAGFAICAIIFTSLLLTIDSTTEGKEAKIYKKYYSDMIVSADDTLWNLGKKYADGHESRKEYADNIIKLNNMTDETIYEGMNLIFYYYVESE